MILYVCMLWKRIRRKNDFFFKKTKAEKKKQSRVTINSHNNTYHLAIDVVGQTQIANT